MSCGVYIHIPFCRAKCPYCDFYSIESGDEQIKLRSDFVGALTSEITSSERISGEVGTVYFGGGTPSILSARQMGLIIEALKNRFKLSAKPEITVEVNPGEVDSERLSAYRDAGVNRLNIGVQTFNSDELITLGRIHKPQESLRTYEESRRSGFENIGLDFIYGVPGQTLSPVLESIETLLNLRPEHISVYALTYEKGTPFYRMRADGALKPMKEERELEISRAIATELTKAGYERYEVSNYALPGRRSRHNSSYWEGNRYLGFGPSAHSFDGNVRWWNVRDVHIYINNIDDRGSAVAGSEELTLKQKMFERAFLGLRTADGISLKRFKQDFGFSFTSVFQKAIDKAAALKSERGAPLVLLTDKNLSVTAEGMDFADEIATYFAS